ncbi:MAG: LacI family DNA-binding transcriptional regulator [Firmicutes bacterium]|nr:LacI family DNA-binding transcriptional regulator [Bacillota bacterium]
MRVTIEDVARLAGVSKSTVSIVINGQRGVSEATRQAVRQAIEKLGYRPDGVARSLKKRHSDVIGLVLPDITNPFFPEVAKGVGDCARAAGYTVLLCNTENSPAEEVRAVDALIERRVDGVILVSSGKHSDHLIDLKKTAIPAVLVDREAGGIGLSTVSVDNIAGAYDAVTHLIGLGHRRIGFLSGPLDVLPNKQRHDGYRLALGNAGIKYDAGLVKTSDELSPDEAWVLTGQLLDQETHRPTAVFAFSDLWAIKVISAARERGFHVPGDLAVVGFDDTMIAPVVDPPLSSVSQPKYEMGRCAVELLLEAISDKEVIPRAVVLKPELVVRASCGAHPLSQGNGGAARRRRRGHRSDVSQTRVG